MEPPRKLKSSGMPVKEEVESEDGNDLLVKRCILKKRLVKRRKIEVSGSMVQLQQQTEVFDMENKSPDGRPVEDSNGKDTKDVLTSCAVQNSVQANGHSNESASSRLLKVCKTICCKEPLYDFEEQGPPHDRLFKCMATVHVDGLVNTILECCSDPKPRKEDAQENAAQGALWLLQRSGYAKCSSDVPE